MTNAEKTQIDPKTGRAIRQVKVIKIEGTVVTVTALNGPMRGATYTIPREAIA